jgi:hypothetical protein
MRIHLDYALRLLDRGVVCLPLREGAKHLDLQAMGYVPLHMRTMRKDLKELAFTGIAFHLSQFPPSRDTIGRWFDGFQGNVGILGGYANLLVLDFDNAEDFGRWRRTREALVGSTPVARSPSGFHVFLKSDEPVVSSSLHFGLRRVGHAKSLGGYVVGSPSVLKNGAGYSWLPGQSPFDVEPHAVTNLAAVSLLPVSPLKHLYDRLWNRGYFEEQ